MIQTADITVQTREETCSQEYVEWKGQKVRIPDLPYNAGGILTRYTPEKVDSTLDFYYEQLLEGDFREVHEEEREEQHHPRLLDTALLTIFRESKDGLKERLKQVLKKRHLKFE